MAGEDFAFIARCIACCAVSALLHIIFLHQQIANRRLVRATTWLDNMVAGVSRRATPSAFLFLGIRNETLGSVPGLHNAKFKLDQTALKTGAAMHAALASEWLAKQAAARQGGSSDEL